jgi:hypothetical protein
MQMDASLMGLFCEIRESEFDDFAFGQLLVLAVGLGALLAIRLAFGPM